VYYKNNKYFISTTDLQAKKVYVFDETGELLPKFPVFGAAKAHFSTNKKDVQFIVKGEDHELLVYQIN
jgi:3-deoxy-D-arabino-heptulosonate 7-phosphate (DAHP) synthase